MAQPENVKVAVNRRALAEHALTCSPDRASVLYRHTHAALARLGVRAMGAKPLRYPTRSAGAAPGVHDVVRWLDDLKLERRYRRDLVYLRRLHATLAQRVPRRLVRELGKL